MTVREPRAPVGPWASPEDRAEAWERYHARMDEYHEACYRAEEERRDRMAMEAILTAGVTATRTMDQAKVDAAINRIEKSDAEASRIYQDAFIIAAACREQQEQLRLTRRTLRATIEVLEGVTDVLDHGGFRADLVDEVITLSRDKSRVAREALKKTGEQHGSDQD